MPDNLVEVSYEENELIPTAKFANVTIGPVRITKKVKPDEVASALVELGEAVDKFLELRREQVLEEVGSA